LDLLLVQKVGLKLKLLIPGLYYLLSSNVLFVADTFLAVKDYGFND